MFGEDICVIPCTTFETMVLLNTMARILLPEPVIDAYYYEYTAILRFVINTVLGIRVVKGIKGKRNIIKGVPLSFFYSHFGLSFLIIKGNFFKAKVLIDHLWEIQVLV